MNTTSEDSPSNKRQLIQSKFTQCLEHLLCLVCVGRNTFAPGLHQW